MSTAALPRGGITWLAMRIAAPGTGRPSPRGATRMALAIAPPLAIGLALGYPVLGMIAALAAFFTALIEPVGGYRRHVLAYLVMVPVNAAVAALASAVAGTTWQAAIAGLAVGVASGILVGSTSRVAVVGPFPLFLFVVVQGTAPQPDIWAVALVAASGAAWVALASVALMPFAPFAPGEVHVAEAWKAVSLLARDPRDQRRRMMALAAIEAARANLVATPGRSRRWHARRRRLWESLGHAEGASMAIMALGASGVPADDLTREVEVFARQVAWHAMRMRRVPSPDALRGALGRFRDQAPDPAARTAQRVVDRLATGAAALDASGTGGTAIPPWTPPAILQPLRQSARWGSPGLRHGLRLGVGAGGAMAIIGASGGSFLDLTAHGPWVTITLVDVLAPSLGASYQRLTQRALGTAAGAALAAVLIWLLGDPWLVALAAVVLGTTAAFIRFVNYAWFMVLFTPLVLLIATTTAPLGPDAAAERIVATLIGCGLGFIIALVVLPTRTGADLPEALAKAVDAIGDDVDAGLAAARAGGSTQDLVAVHRAAIAAADDALQVFDGVVIESLSRRVTRAPAATMEATTFALLEQAATLGTRLPDRAAVVPGTEAAAERLAASLHEVAAAIRERRVPRGTDDLEGSLDRAAVPDDEASQSVADALAAMLATAQSLAMATARWAGEPRPG